MGAFTDKMTHQWRDVANLILGLWLLISPWVLSYMGETVAAWNAYIVGIIVAVAAAAALVAFHKWEEWVNVALAAWLIISPFLLSYPMMSHAMTNQIVVGVVTGLLALWTAITTDEHGVAT
jgi:SPW repeat-containing protein